MRCSCSARHKKSHHKPHMTIYHQQYQCVGQLLQLLLHSGPNASPLLILSVVHNSSKEETPVIFVFYQTTGSIAMLAMAPVLSTLPIASFSYTELYDLRLTQNCHQIKQALLQRLEIDLQGQNLKITLSRYLGNLGAARSQKNGS